MMKHSNALILVMGLCILPSVTHAKENKVPDFIQQKYALRLAEIKQFDANGDNALDAAEFRALLEYKFISMDTDRSGDLSTAEIEGAALRGLGGKGYNETQSQQYTMRIAARFKSMDRDKSKTVSRAEYNKGFAARINGFDKNKDGLVDKTEYRLDEEKSPPVVVR